MDSGTAVQSKPVIIEADMSRAVKLGEGVSASVAVGGTATSKCLSFC